LVRRVQYLGGKSRIAKQLCAAINPIRRGRTVWDAFCGGLSISAELAKAGPVLSSDANPALISLYQGLERGTFDPPVVVTEEEYHAAKLLPDSDPRKAFIGFGCAFGGKWFGGYARSKDPKDSRSQGGTRTYASQCRNSLLEDVGLLKPAGWVVDHENFLDVDPRGPAAAILRSCVLYLDPPYAGTEAYGATAPFDHDKFWALVREWSYDTDVFVSEYGCPLAAAPLLEFKHDLSVSGGVTKDARTERLYHFSPRTPHEDFKPCR
jgi:DNA adenine methylase